ncbi:MAG: YgiT-type zinc finger protein [Anaerolineae bacterium]
MTGELENDRCYFCGGKLAPALATIPFVMSTGIVIIKEVPAEVCIQCSEPIMTSEVAAVVDGLLKQMQRSGFEVSIVPYEQLALALA